MKESKEAKETVKWKEKKKEGRIGGTRKKKSRTEDDTLTRLEEIVFLCRDFRHTLQRTLAAGNKLPLEISESLLRGARDRVVARNNFIVFLRWYRGRDRVVPDGPEGNTARSATGEFECADDISLCRRGRTEERRC